MTKRAAMIASSVAAAAILVFAGVALASATDDAVPTADTIPADAVNQDGSLDPDKVPDFVVTSGRDGEHVGFTAKEDLVVEEGRTSPQQDNEERTPVYGDDLTTVVGHMYDGVGFVPKGEAPAEPSSPPTTATGSDPAEDR